MSGEDGVRADRVPDGRDAGRRVVIVGAGFGGLACARVLGGTALRVTVIDKRNFSLFTPLLYQVATAALSPAEIAPAIRHILSRFRNIEIVMAEVVGVDREQKLVRLAAGPAIPYDVLVLAPGSTYSYFGHEDWAANAPGLKTIGDARAIRASLLRGFELAETSTDPDRQRALLTTVIVGAGPTGVEMAGAIAELARFTLAKDFRRIDPASARVLLLEAGQTVLSAFPASLRLYASERLRKAGVEVRLGTPVRAVTPNAVTTDQEHIEAGTVVWAAGIRAVPASSWLGLQPDAQGRLPLRDNLAVAGTEDVYAIGDVGRFVQAGTSLPALAQVAKQQGIHLGRALRAGDGTKPPGPFRYRSRGDTAVIGRHAAVFVIGRWRFRGPLAWLLWLFIHIYLLIGANNRMRVAIEWVWRYFTYETGARLID